MLLPLVGGLVTVALLAACSQTVGPAAPEALAGSSWILTDVAIDGALLPAIDDSASLSFGADGAVAGSTGCNRFTGTWQADADRLTITPGATTLRGCPGELGTQEAGVLAALGATHAYRGGGQTLELLDSQGAAVARYRTAAVELAGTAWRATGVNNGRGGVESAAGTDDLTLEFAADATVSGFDGCGVFTGTFTTEGDRIAIKAEAGAACADPWQQPYLAALGSATTWRVDGNRLELRDGGGALQVGLRQR